MAPCQGIWGQFLQRLEINLQFHSYWDFLDDEAVSPYLETGRFPGGAQEFETAFALAVFPRTSARVRCRTRRTRSRCRQRRERGGDGRDDHTRVAAHCRP
ncbi:MAG: hypothetical protein Ct9H300mP1_10830 [Planctomycetaceae bacterium]|nr:MAG: hypothetical protein Ct9H300mP1_10830 [Planctomycetaceae bacterium]